MESVFFSPQDIKIGNYFINILNSICAIKSVLQHIHNPYDKNVEVSLDNIDKLIEYNWGQQILYDFIINDKDIDIIKYLIDKDVDSARQPGSTLNYAAYNGRLDVVKYLIEETNIEIDICSGWVTEQTCLMSAVNSNRLDIVKYLINNNANIHHISPSGGTAFSCAIQERNIDIIKYLIDVIGKDILLYEISFVPDNGDY